MTICMLLRRWTAFEEVLYDFFGAKKDSLIEID